MNVHFLTFSRVPPSSFRSLIFVRRLHRPERSGQGSQHSQLGDPSLPAHPRRSPCRVASLIPAFPVAWLPEFTTGAAVGVWERRDTAGGRRAEQRTFLGVRSPTGCGCGVSFPASPPATELQPEGGVGEMVVRDPEHCSRASVRCILSPDPGCRPGRRSSGRDFRSARGSRNRNWSVRPQRELSVLLSFFLSFFSSRSHAIPFFLLVVHMDPY